MPTRLDGVCDEFEIFVNGDGGNDDATHSTLTVGTYGLEHTTHALH